MCGFNLEVAQTPLQDMIQVNGRASSIAKRLGSDIESHLRDQRGRTTHFDLQRRLWHPAFTRGFPRFLKNLKDKSARCSQPQITFSYRALKHRTLSQRHLFPVASTFRTRQVNNGVKRPAANPQSDSRKLVNKETRQTELVQRPTALGLHSL